jgi:16S rRNA (cytidine1402-2'-O)-methyltransferase
VWRGPLGNAVAATEEREPRGEYVIVIDGAAPPAAPDDDGLLDALRNQLAGGATRRDAVATVAAATGLPRRRIYDLALTI